MLEAHWRSLQASFLAAVGDRSPFELNTGTMVVIPSLTLPADELKDVAGIQFYEERLLFLLLQLAKPNARLIFISTSEISPEIIDYYLDFLPDKTTARDRLALIAVGDTGQQPLTAKLLAHEEKIVSVRNFVQAYGKAYLLPFVVTTKEEELAARLGIPIYGMPSDAAHLGGKIGGRRVARIAGVPVIDGIDNIRMPEDIKVAFNRLCGQDTDRAVLKLNDSFSGMGNVILSSRSVDAEIQVAEGLWALLPQGVTSWDDYLSRLFARRGVMELMVEGPLTAPSVQMLVKPGRVPEVISTHDQILGGMANQLYLGCAFPANGQYRDKIIKYGQMIADVLAEEGVVGVFSVDFLVSQPYGEVYFGEINLRLGGTTHPFEICRDLTKAAYDAITGLLMSASGPRYYVASDNVQDHKLIGKSPADVLKLMSETGLLFDDSRLAGITMHQMGSLPDSGKLGVCSIAASAEEARSAFQSALEALRRD